MNTHFIASYSSTRTVALFEITKEQKTSVYASVVSSTSPNLFPVGSTFQFARHSLIAMKGPENSRISDLKALAYSFDDGEHLLSYIGIQQEVNEPAVSFFNRVVEKTISIAKQEKERRDAQAAESEVKAAKKEAAVSALAVEIGKLESLRLNGQLLFIPQLNEKLPSITIQHELVDRHYSFSSSAKTIEWALIAKVSGDSRSFSTVNGYEAVSTVKSLNEQLIDLAAEYLYTWYRNESLELIGQ